MKLANSGHSIPTLDREIISFVSLLAWSYPHPMVEENINVLDWHVVTIIQVEDSTSSGIEKLHHYISLSAAWL